MLSTRTWCEHGLITRYLGLTERDRLMVVLPFAYSYGNSLLLTPAVEGRCGQPVVPLPNTVLDQMIAERAPTLRRPSTYASC
jgi:hypothetical protein